MTREPRTSDATVERTAARPPRRVPLGTYRLQLNASFAFEDARQVLDYLARLGVSDCYTSPYFTARPGSSHGYDVADHNAINPELGGAAGFARFVEALDALGMGHVVDVVPNHMGIDARGNAWWRDVLENGSCSPWARFFDIDWFPAKVDLADRVLLPILGDQYGSVLLRGELSLAFEDGQLVLRYFDHRLPVNPRQAPRVYRHGLASLKADLGEEHPDLMEFLSILTALHNLPAYTDRDPDSIAVRRREKEVARRRLARLVETSARVRAHVDRAMLAFNGEPGRPESFDALHELLESQPYRLAYWRTAAHEINYRRFFDNNDLAGLRVEDAAVFEATHALLFELMRAGHALCLRIDHPDGLYDPASYFDMVQALARRAWAGADLDDDRPTYVVAEKILSAGERLPARWAVHGTTGYDFLNDVNGLFVQPSSARRLRRLYARLTGRQEPFDDAVYTSKRLIMETALASELTVLTHAVDRIAESNRDTRDFTMNSLRDALTEVVACFPVYRTYVTEAGWTRRDREIIEEAVARARRRNPALEPSVFAFLRDVLAPAGAERREDRAPFEDRATAWRLQVAMRFQQYTAPVQAKGVEDTAFYRYNALLSLNEVGGDPARVGRSSAEFHESNRRRLDEWPYGLLATSTHDTKLGEDVRTRLDVLSELVDEWGREVSRWMRLNRGNRRLVDGEPAPDRNDEYRFYQVLVGIWPPGHAEPVAPPHLVARVRDYMIKAIREAKLHTSWINDNQAYDEATAAFVEQTLAGPTSGRFLTALLPFARRVAAIGAGNSLAQTALKLCSPGVPDLYQGSELWDLSLVDPDNRRAVDFARRRELLESLEPLLDARGAARAAEVGDLLKAWPDGRIKLYVTASGLRARRRDPELFLAGTYTPLETETVPGADAVAFARQLDDRAIVVVAPRLWAGIAKPDRPFPLDADAWTISRVLLPPALAGRAFRNLLTGERLEPARKPDEAWLFLARVFATLPVAILEAVD
jgi:(1->4)-alpha-D-glucan 1-alpha-D-glucosylmutase